MKASKQTLSVCCLANSPGPFLRAALEPLREIADEVIVAAGGTLPEEDLRCYGEVADRLFSIEFSFVERHLAWLHAQCSGDWILRLDGDEVVSPAMVEEVLAAREDRRLCSVVFARRHLFPTVERYLTQEPWYPDFQVRMVRNNGSLRFSGLLHTAAERTLPARTSEAPLYHLPFIVGTPDQREARARRYELFRPDLVAPTGLRVADAMLPETLQDLATAATPPEDRHGIETVMSASGEGSSTLEATPVGLADMDSSWAGRALPESAYRATVQLVGTPVPFTQGETRPVYFRVCNEGTEEWPWDPLIGPHIHVVHRLLDATGKPIGGWRPSFFTEWIEPGSATVVPGHLEVPHEPGRYVLQVTVRHAPERLFGEVFESQIVVRPGGAWAVCSPTRA